MNREITDWEKLSVNHIGDKGLVPRICKELSKVNNKHTNDLMFFNGQKI